MPKQPWRGTQKLYYPRTLQYYVDTAGIRIELAIYVMHGINSTQQKGLFVFEDKANNRKTKPVLLSKNDYRNEAQVWISVIDFMPGKWTLYAQHQPENGSAVQWKSNSIEF